VWRACAAALAAAVLARWWSRIWFQSFRDAVKQRRYANANAPAKNKTVMK
jgi:hypothetical protein